MPDHPIVTEEAIKAAEHAYIHGPEKTVPEMFGAALDAAAPLIQKQVEERVRERLLSDEAVEAASRKFEPQTWREGDPQSLDEARRDARVALLFALDAVTDCERCGDCGSSQRWPRPRILNEAATHHIYCPNDFHGTGKKQGGLKDG